MKKTTVRMAALLLAVLMLAALAGCAGEKIYIEEGKDLIVSCPRRAKPGDTVTVETMCVTDADLYVSVNGSKEGVTCERDGVFTFVMPQGGARVKAWVVSNGLA